MPKLDGVLSNGYSLSIPANVIEEVEVSVPSREMLAISLSDLMRLPPDMVTKLVKDRLDLSRTVAGGSEADPAIVFQCPLLDAAMVCNIVRSQDKSTGDQPCRVYLNKNSSTNGWQPIRNDTELVVVVDSVVELNPLLFDVPVKQLPSRAPTILPVEF